uniref:Seed biotin-containing protein SBP65 n=1 Tax=Cajanus cajan TaxID=3821 RepID=A0A151SEU4_CAJCA|nr:Seed biotin-containing protein SBP65 [Cajanus cajan]
MASEQLVRRENTTTTDDKVRVPKMATRFENLTGGNDTPQGSMEALQGGELNKEHEGKSIGDVGGRGKARESHELGSHFESLADKVTGEDHKEREGGEREKELQRQTRVVKGRMEKERGRENEGKIVVEKGRVGAENEGAGGTAVITSTLEKGGDTEKPREENEGIDEADQKSAKETLKNNTSSQTEPNAKDVTLEKGQQGYIAAAKDSITSAVEKAAPVAQKAKGYTLQAAEKAKCAGCTTASYVGEKAVEGGKTAAEYAGKVAVDLKDKAVVAGWAAAHFSTEKTVEGTKAAAHVMEGAAGYAGQKAADLASKSAGAVKGLAASAGETAKDYTARKKEEAKRELEAKKALQSQEAKGIGETVSEHAQEAKPSGGASQQEGTGSNVLNAIGETVSSVGEKVKKPFENMMGGGEGKTESGGQEQKKSVIGETASEIGQNIMKPAERVQEHGQEAKQEDGVLSAIGETIAEIAETARVMVGGEGEKELKQNVGSDTRVTDDAKHEGSQSARV